MVWGGRSFPLPPFLIDRTLTSTSVSGSHFYYSYLAQNSLLVYTIINTYYTESARQLLSGQSVRTRTYSQAWMASRPHEERNQKFADAQAVRELASELRSMSRAQELSNKQQRAEWEAILSELQEIQKTKI